MQHESRTPANGGSSLRRAPRVRVVGIFLAILIAVFAVLWMARLDVAAFVVERYLAARGITSTVAFSQLSIHEIALRLRMGSESQPGAAVENIKVGLEYSGGVLPRVAAVEVTRPTLRIVYDDAGLSFGALQPLIDAFSSPGGTSTGPVPMIAVRDAQVSVETPGGIAVLALTASVDQDGLADLDAVLQPATLRAASVMAVVSGGTVKAVRDGKALNLDAALDIASLSAGEPDAATARDLKVSLNMRGVEWASESDTMRVALTNAVLRVLSGNASMATASVAASETEITLDNFAGTRAAGKLNAKGRVVLKTDLRDLSSGDAKIAKLAGSAISPAFQFDMATGAWSVAGPIELTTHVDDGAYAVDAAALRVPRAMSSFAGTVNIGSAVRAVTLSGNISGDTTLPRDAALRLARALPGIGTDKKLTAAIARALSAMTLDIPAVRLAYADNVAEISLPQPVQLNGAGGARMTLREGALPLARGNAASVSGSLGLKLQGGALPAVDLAVARYAYAAAPPDAELSEPELTAQVDIGTTLDFAAFRGLHVAGTGGITMRGATTTFTASRCANVGFASFTAADAEQIGAASAKFCGGTDTPLFALDAEGWRVDGAWSQASARIIAAGAQLADGAGRVQLAGEGADLKTGRVDLGDLKLSDEAAAPRFAPLTARGGVTLARGLWQGSVSLMANAKPLAAITIRHAMATGAGSAALQETDLTFGPAGLQPADVSPLLANAAAGLSGRARIAGRVAWSADGLTSDAKLTAADLTFRSPAGGITGAGADITFTSLVPIVAQGAQVSVKRLDSFVPLEDVAARFDLTAEAVVLNSVTARMAGGTISMGSTKISLQPDLAAAGTVNLAGVNLPPLLLAAGLKDRVTVQGAISGAVPFSYGPEGLRFAGGHVFADAPGRLSIKREALTGAVGLSETAGGNVADIVEAPAPNAVQDFAYQALANLAFDTMEGRIDSRPNQRLGVVLRLKGRHDPSEDRPARVGILSLLRGTAFDTPIPLPKSTPIDLTLDTSLNLDELLNSYFGGRGVTPSP
jgi:hypothetical protein